MKKTSLIAGILLALLVIWNPLYSQEKNQKLIKEIDALNAKLIKANIAGDMETVASLYTNDIIHMPNYAPAIKGKKLMMEKEKEAEEAGFKMLSMIQIIKEVFPSNNMVIEVGEYIVSLEIPNSPAPVEDVGKYLTVWERQKDGSLKIKIETWNTSINPMEKGMDQKKKEKIEKENK